MVLACLLLAAQAAQPAPSPLDRLKASIERITRSANATWGIYVKSLETGEEVAINADRQMDTMSVIKIPLMAEVYYQIKEGKFKLSDRYPIKAEDLLPGTGVLRSLDAGESITVKDLITLMIIVSDNTATDVLFNMVGGVEPVNRRMATLGLKHTRATAPSRTWFAALRKAPSAEAFHRAAQNPYGLSSPHDIGVLLEQMERGVLVDKESSAQMLQIMRGQLYRSRIPRYLTGFAIPHKTGDFMPYIGNDVGVLELAGDKRVVVSIFTANHFGNGWMLEDAIGQVSQAVAGYFEAK